MTVLVGEPLWQPITLGAAELTGYTDSGQIPAPGSEDVLRVEVRLSDAVLTVVPALPAEAPWAMAVRTSPVMPTPTLVDGRPMQPWQPDIVRDTWGYPQTIVNGVDVSRVRGAPTEVGGLSWQEPFGDATAILTFPAVTPFDVLGAGADLSWYRDNAQVELWRIKGDGTRDPAPIFEGYLSNVADTDGPREGPLVLEAAGALFQASLAQYVPPFYVNSEDAGVMIPRLLSEVVGRRYHPPVAVTTGIPVVQNGEFADKVLTAVANVLGTLTTNDGTSQWTIRKLAQPGRAYVMQLKDRTSVHWTVSVGQPGVEVRLDRDVLSVVNVIYGEGVAPDGCHWVNAQYPGQHPDDTLPYPMASASQVISVGGRDTDSETATGRGVTDWQLRMNALGYPLPVDGNYGSQDRGACRDVQFRRGILVDGIIGPQTWAAVFEPGSNVGNVNVAFIMPIAWDPRVMPRLYGGDGADAGPNPSYDPSVLRREDYINFGESISKADATREAYARINRDKDPGWNGTIGLQTDPQEGSRFSIQAGHNLKLRHHRGVDRLLHIAETRWDSIGGAVQLTVDTNARDLQTLTEIRRRNDQNTTPAKQHAGEARAAARSRDIRAVFDCESGAGIIPRVALYRRLWTVLRIPMAEHGTIVRTELTTTSPASPFSVAVFENQISAATLISVVGDPLADNGKGYGRLTEEFDNLNFVIGWGQHGQAMGYYPGTEQDEDPLTGRFIDGGSWEFYSAAPPWLWVAFYATSSCYVQGRIQVRVGD